MKLPINEDVLDKLGFSEYWDENCDWGGRTLTFSDGTRFRIIENGYDPEYQDGYLDKVYRPQHYYFATWFATPKIEVTLYESDLYFLHEMYEVINAYYPHCLEEFVNLCDKVYMKFYIDSYLISKRIQKLMN